MINFKYYNKQVQILENKNTASYIFKIEIQLNIYKKNSNNNMNKEARFGHYNN